MSFSMGVDLDEESEENRTIYCGNLSENVTDKILFELFHQAGPVESVRRPRDPNGRPKSFGFVVYKHGCSVPYALEILRGIKLFNRIINMNSRSILRHVPVLDTHITEFTQPKVQVRHEKVNFQEAECSRYQEDSRKEINRSDRNDKVYVQEPESKMYQYMEENRRKRSRTDKHRHGNRKRDRDSQRQIDTKEPTSWAEFNALHGKNSVHNLQPDLQGYPKPQIESSNRLQMIPDFNSLLQMGQQMLLSPGLMGMGGCPLPNTTPAVLGHSPGFRGDNVLSGMPVMKDGGERNSSERERGRRDNHKRKESRRNHPYNFQVHHNNQDNHGRHDQTSSSSRSSHDRERRDRRSR